MIIEAKLVPWIRAGLERYRTTPQMLELVFFDASHVGTPTVLGPGLLTDTEKLWLPNEYAPEDGVQGMVRWGGETFPILSNTADTLTVSGDPSMAVPQEPFCYQIVPPAVARLTTFLSAKPVTVLSSFAQVPTAMPAITIRLEKEEQAQTYLAESLRQYGEDGIEFDIRSQALQASYLLSIWTENREATLYLYAWLQNYVLNSLPLFATWGLYDVGVAGSDLDPALQYLAERTYTRHLLLTTTRVERAVTMRPVEWVSDLCIKVYAHYAQIPLHIMPAME